MAMLMDPPRPIVDRPDPIEIAPLLPDFANPLLNVTKPLAPFVPASDVLMVMAPLEVAAPAPAVSETAPPV
jgi:hypothetical protein